MHLFHIFLSLIGLLAIWADANLVKFVKYIDINIVFDLFVNEKQLFTETKNLAFEEKRLRYVDQTDVFMLTWKVKIEFDIYLKK